MLRMGDTENKNPGADQFAGKKQTETAESGKDETTESGVSLLEKSNDSAGTENFDSEILDTSNSSEATEPGNQTSAEESRIELKRKLNKFLEWCMVNGLALSNKVFFMLFNFLVLIHLQCYYLLIVRSWVQQT